MNEVERLPFEKIHLTQIELQPHEKEFLNLDGFTAMASQPTSRAYTYMYKEHILGFGGYYMVWPGVIEIFIVPSMYFFKYPKTCVATCKRDFELIKRNKWIHRIQTYSWDDYTRNGFMLHMGFECEGVLRRYTSSKQDYKMWSILVEA